MANYSFTDNNTGETVTIPWSGSEPPKEKDIDQYRELNKKPKVSIGDTLNKATGIGPAPDEPWYNQLADFATDSASKVGNAILTPWNIAGHAAQSEHPIDDLVESLRNMMPSSQTLNTGERLNEAAKMQPQEREQFLKAAILPAQQHLQEAENHPFKAIGNAGIDEALNTGMGLLAMGHGGESPKVEAPIDQALLDQHRVSVPQEARQFTSEPTSLPGQVEEDGLPQNHMMTDQQWEAMQNELSNNRPDVRVPGEPVPNINSTNIPLGQSDYPGWTPPSLDIPPPEPSLMERLQQNFFSGDPATERGAVGDIGPLNQFETSQFNKYGKGWRELQSPEEAQYHQKLLSGQATFSKIPNGTSSEDLAPPPNIPQGTSLKGADGSIDVAKVKEFLDAARNPKGIVAPPVENALPQVQNPVPQEAAPQISLPPAPVEPEPLPLPEDAAAADVTDTIKPLQKSVWASNAAEPPIDVTNQIKQPPISKQTPSGAPDPNVIPKTPDEFHRNILEQGLSASRQMTYLGHGPAAFLTKGRMLLTNPPSLKGMVSGMKGLTEAGHLKFVEGIRDTITKGLDSTDPTEVAHAKAMQPIWDRANLMKDPDEIKRASDIQDIQESPESDFIPGAKQSSRQYRDITNGGIVGTLDPIYDRLKEQGLDPSNPEHAHVYNQWTDAVNTLMRRAPLPDMLKKYSRALNTAISSTSNITSDIKTISKPITDAVALGKQALGKGPGVTAGTGFMYRNIAQSVGLATVAMIGAEHILNSQGIKAKFTINPFSDDFGKVSAGDHVNGKVVKTKFALLQGLNTQIKDAAQAIGGQYETTSGKNYKLAGASPAGIIGAIPKGLKVARGDSARSGLGILGSYVQQHLAPGIMPAYHAYQGNDGFGHQYNLADAAKDTFAPMALKGLYEGYNAPHSDSLHQGLNTAVGAVSGLGVPSSFPSDKKKYRPNDRSY